MTSVTKFFLRPRVNLSMTAASVVAEVLSWFTTFDDPYVTPVAFCLTLVFGGLFALNEHIEAEKLRAAAKPTLSLVFGQGQLYDSTHGPGRHLRIFRVGVLNTGDAPVHQVAVKLARVHPALPRVFPMQELQQTHEPNGVSRFTVNKSTEPLVFVDVIHQFLWPSDGERAGTFQGEDWRKGHRKGETHNLYFEFADTKRDLRDEFAHPASRYEEQYLIWLVIDGEAAEAPRKFVLRRNDHGQYDFSEAFP